MKNTFIYALCCPLTEEIRYIGKANKPKERFSKHKCLAGNNLEKNKWIKGLLDNNLLPIIKILEEVSIDDWKEKEKYYILKYKELGCDLLNMSGGGEGSYFGNTGSFNGKNAVKIVCLTKEGNYVSTFDSVKNGQEFCGHKLYNVLNGNTKTTGGYLWLYEGEYNKLSEIELKKFVENCNINVSGKNEKCALTQFKKGQKSWNTGIKGIKTKPNKNVHQYTKENCFMKTWNTAKEASIELTGIERGENNISKCARNEGKTAFGYKWFYNKIDGDND